MIIYCHSTQLEQFSNRLPSNLGRSSLIHGLIAAYGLWEHEHLIVLEPELATHAELLKYHSSLYLEALLKLDVEECILEQHGLHDDCPIFVGLPEYVCHVAGASIRAATALTQNNRANAIAINWDGGRHHAKKGAASGFCYVADAVLAIQKLREEFSGVVYIDLDVHHGDGVEAAFVHSDNVLAISLHRYDSGFFPCTGGMQDRGKGKGRGYTINVPLGRGLRDASLIRLVEQIVIPALQAYHSKKNNIAIVVQCGVDGLSQDPLRQWNISIDGFCDAILAIQAQATALNASVLYLGGGGYNKALTSRCYASLTARLLGVTLSEHIPEHDLYSEYADTVYELATQARMSGMKDENENGMAALIEHTRNNIARYIGNTTSQDMIGSTSQIRLD